MNACLPVFARIKVWSSSCSLYHKTHRSFFGERGGGSGRKVEKTISLSSPWQISCAWRWNCVSGERRSVSRACSGTAQRRQPGCHLEAHQMEASPETEPCPQSVGLYLLTYFEDFFVWRAHHRRNCGSFSLSQQLEMNHFSMKHTH